MKINPVNQFYFLFSVLTFLMVNNEGISTTNATFRVAL